MAEEIEKATDIEIFNPYYDDNTRKSDTSILDAKQIYDRMSSIDMDCVTDHECRIYIEEVKDNIERCDAILAVPGADNHTISFVVMLAVSMGKEVFLISSEFKNCPWFRIYSSCIFHDLGAFKAFFSH